AAWYQRWYPETREGDAVGEIQRADLGTDLQTDDVARDNRPEVEAYSELLVLHADCTDGAALHDRDRNFAAGEEACFLTVVGDQIRFGETLQQPFGLKRTHERADVVLRVEGEDVEQVAQRDIIGRNGVERRRGRIGRDPKQPILVAAGTGENRNAGVRQRLPIH